MSDKVGVRNDGKEYEAIVASIHRQFAGIGTKVTEDEKVVGKSDQERQIDVAIRTSISGYKVFIVVECKDYTKKIGVGKVDELVGKIEDVGADKGILVSNSGFTKDAVDRAKKDNRLQLSSVVDIKNDKLKPKLAIPFLVHFDSAKNLQLRFDFVGDAALLIDQVELEKNLFFKLWNEGNLDTQPGERTHIHTLRDDDKGKLVVTFTYTVQRTSYFKQVPMEDSVGIYNHTSGGYTTKQMVLQPIKATDFDSWDIVTGEMPYAMMVLYGVEQFSHFSEPEEQSREDVDPNQS